MYLVWGWSPEGPRDRLGPVADEPPLDLALASAEAIEASVVYLAGFDGYRNASTSDQANARDVQEAMAMASTRWKTRKIASITPTTYDVPRQSVYALVQVLKSA